MASETSEHAEDGPRRSPSNLAVKILLGFGVVVAGVVVGRFALGLLSPHLYTGTVFQSATPAPDLGGLVFDSGEPATLSEFEDQIVLVYFGYTHCPDVCPTTLSDAAKAIDELGDQHDRVNLVMVTIDPERDEPSAAGDYVRFFDDRFRAVGGDPAEIADVATQFGVYYQQGPVAADGSYDVDHTASLMGIDTDGNLRIVWPPGVSSEALAADLTEMLK